VLIRSHHPPVVFEFQPQLGFGHRSVTVKIGIHEPHRGVCAIAGGGDGVVDVDVGRIDRTIAVGIEAQNLDAQSLQIAPERSASLDSSRQKLVWRSLPVERLCGGLAGNDQSHVTDGQVTDGQGCAV